MLFECLDLTRVQQRADNLIHFCTCHVAGALDRAELAVDPESWRRAPRQEEVGTSVVPEYLEPRRDGVCIGRSQRITSFVLRVNPKRPAESAGRFSSLASSLPLSAQTPSSRS